MAKSAICFEDESLAVRVPVPEFHRAFLSDVYITPQGSRIRTFEVVPWLADERAVYGKQLRRWQRFGRFVWPVVERLGPSRPRLRALREPSAKGNLKIIGAIISQGDPAVLLGPDFTGMGET